MDFNTKIFKQTTPFFKDLGFLEAEFSEQFGLMRFSFQKEDLKYFVGLSFALDKIALNGMHYKITIQGVNDILSKFIDLERNSEFYTLHDYRQKSHWTAEVIKLGKELVVLKSNIDNSYSKLVTSLNKFVLPFFNKYPDITAVNEKILNQVPEKDYPEWIHGQSTLKILIIMKLCDNPKYEAYKASKEKEYLFFVNQNPTMWKPAYDTFVSLVKYLG